jgi:UDP-2,4-diacetamido-2,4,6-trideoxy-beta-L-altropyranose hydrolase
MQVVFRTDASQKMGTGHVMRCLTLAEELRDKGVNCRFISREHPGNLIDLIAQRGFEVFALPYDESQLKTEDLGLNLPKHTDWLGSNWVQDADETLASIGNVKVNWLIIDHYALDKRWEEKLRSACIHLMIIDDLADRPHNCDLLLDQNWFGKKTDSRYEDLVPKNCKKFLGPQYALLKPEYVQLRNLMPPRDGIIRRILVFLGGSDPTNETAKVLIALSHPALTDLAVDVVIGITHPNPQSIEKLVTARPSTILYKSLPSLAGLMARADLMIGGGGSTNWERMSLGLPTIVISIADNQTETNRDLMDAGYLNFLGPKDAVTSHDISAAVQDCLPDYEKMRYQSTLMQDLVTGSGAIQLSEYLLSNSKDQ